MKYKNRKNLYNLSTPDGYVKCSCGNQDHRENVYSLGWKELYTGNRMAWYCPDCQEMEKYR